MSLNIICQDGAQEETETAQGVWAHRRQLLSFGAASMTIAALANAAKAFAADENISFEQFLAAANAKAEELIADSSAAGQDRYLRAIASCASGLADAPAPAAWNDSGQSDGPGTFIGFNPGGERFTVLHWRMEPGTRILPHAHTYGSVVTVGLEGAALVTNYEALEVPDFEATTTFHAKKTLQQALRHGDVNLVSLERNYMHGFEAGERGARGLDITTRLKPKPTYSTPYLQAVDDAAPTKIGEEFEAVWRRS